MIYFFNWTFFDQIAIYWLDNTSGTGYIIPGAQGAQGKIKMCSPLLKIKTFHLKMVTSEHLIECGALLSTGPWVTWGPCLTHIGHSWS